MSSPAIIGFTLLAGYFLFQNLPLLIAAAKRLGARGFHSNAPIENAHQAISDHACRLLEANPGNVGRRHRSREEAMTRNLLAGKAPINTFGNTWLAIGLLANLARSGDRGTANALHRHLNLVVNEDGTLREPLTTVDQCMLGGVLLDLHEQKPSERYTGAVRIMQGFLETHPRSPSGLLLYREAVPDTLFIDTLGMVCPLLARCGRQFNAPALLDLAFRQAAEFHENAWDPTTGLLFHAYNESDKIALGLRGWTRGLGWYAVGLAETIPHIPPESEQREILLDHFLGLVNATKRFQKPNGCWSWEMPNRAADDDTSGTAMIAYAIARACLHRFLPADYLGICHRALSGIASHTTQGGRVLQSLADADGIGVYSQVYGNTPWGQGAALALSATLNETNANSPRSPR